MDKPLHTVDYSSLRLNKKSVFIIVLAIFTIPSFAIHIYVRGVESKLMEERVRLFKIDFVRKIEERGF